MLLSAFKQNLSLVENVSFTKQNGGAIPSHFHITEVGQVNKRFIDCGGTVRNEQVITMQLWESVDYWHRLKPKALEAIIDLATSKLALEDLEVEIEYQSETIGKYSLDFGNNTFVLIPTKTDCLALDKCGIPTIASIKESVQSCCSPSSGCC